MKRAIGWLVWAALRFYVWAARKPSYTFTAPGTGAPHNDGNTGAVTERDDT